MITVHANKVVYETFKVYFLKNYIMLEDYEIKMNTIIPIYQINYIDYDPQNAILEFSEDGNIKVIKERKENRNDLERIRTKNI